MLVANILCADHPCRLDVCQLIFCLDTLKNYFKKYGVVEKTRVVIVSVDIFNNITRIQIRTWRPEDLKVMDLW